MSRRIVFAAVVTSVLVGTLVAAGTAAADPPAGTLKPPQGIFTCSWIAAHPAAAAAWNVSCSPVAPSGSPTVTSSTGSSIQPIPLANGCQTIPGVGQYVGKGVYAWTTYEYANEWGWTPHYSGVLFTWYLQKTGNVTYAWNTGDSAGNINVPATNYRWGAQNNDPQPNNWNVCYYS